MLFVVNFVDIVAVSMSFLITHDADETGSALCPEGIVTAAALTEHIAGGKAVGVAHAMARADETACTHAGAAIIQKVNCVFLAQPRCKRI